jgi:hypothetical protein
MYNYEWRHEEVIADKVGEFLTGILKAGWEVHKTDLAWNEFDGHTYHVLYCRGIDADPNDEKIDLDLF